MQNSDHMALLFLAVVQDLVVCWHRIQKRFIKSTPEYQKAQHVWCHVSANSVHHCLPTESLQKAFHQNRWFIRMRHIQNWQMMGKQCILGKSTFAARVFQPKCPTLGINARLSFHFDFQDPFDEHLASLRGSSMIWMPLPCSAVAQRMVDGAGNVAGWFGGRSPGPQHVFCLLAFCLLACLVGWLGMWWCGCVCLLSRPSVVRRCLFVLQVPILGLLRPGGAAPWMVGGYARWWWRWCWWLWWLWWLWWSWSWSVRLVVVLCCCVVCLFGWFGWFGWLAGCVVVWLCVCLFAFSSARRSSLFVRPAGAYLDFYDLAERLLGWWAVTPGGGGGGGVVVVGGGGGGGCGGCRGRGRFGW